jgi:hypothetical protein
MASGGTGRLAMAIHFAIPPVATLSLLNIVLADKTFAIFKLIGSRLPRIIQLAGSGAYVAAHATFIAASCALLYAHCEVTSLAPLQALGAAESPKCHSVLSGLGFVRLALLFVDRACIAFFLLPNGTARGVKHRIVDAALLISVFVALSGDDPMALLLIAQSYATRGVGNATLDAWLRRTKKVFKVYIVVSAIVCVWSGRPAAPSSRRSAGVAFLAALSWRP